MYCFSNTLHKVHLSDVMKTYLTHWFLPREESHTFKITVNKFSHLDFTCVTVKSLKCQNRIHSSVCEH